MKFLKHSDGVIKNIAKVLSGNIVGQAIIFASTPVLTRLYAVEQVGVFAIFFSMGVLAAVVSCLAYEQAIVIPENEDDAWSVFGASLTSGVLVSVAAALIVFIFGGNIANAVGSTTTIVYTVPVLLFFISISQSCLFFHVRHNRFVVLAIARIIQPVAMVAYQVGMVFLVGPNDTNLVFGFVLGHMCAGLYLAVTVWYFCGFGQKFRVLELMREYKQYPRVLMWSLLLNALSGNASSFVMAYLYGARVVALYAMGIKLLSVPLNLIKRSIRPVYMRRVAKIRNEGGSIRSVLLRDTFFLFLLGILPTLTVLYAGPEIFVLLFGDDWQGTGRYAQVLSFWLFAAFLNLPAVVSLQIMQFHKLLVGYEMALLVSRIGALAAGKLLWDDAYISVCLFSFVGTFGNLFIVFLSWHVAGGGLRTQDHCEKKA